MHNSPHTYFTLPILMLTPGQGGLVQLVLGRDDLDFDPDLDRADRAVLTPSTTNRLKVRQHAVFSIEIRSPQQF